MSLSSSILIAIWIINFINKINSQCFPLDEQAMLSEPSLLITYSQDHDLGGTAIMTDGDMLSSFETRKRTQLVTKRDYPTNSTNSQSTSTERAENSWRDLLWPGNVIPFNYHSCEYCTGKN